MSSTGREGNKVIAKIAITAKIAKIKGLTMVIDGARWTARQSYFEIEQKDLLCE